jgi:hypothetical protein
LRRKTLDRDLHPAEQETVASTSSAGRPELSATANAALAAAPGSTRVVPGPSAVAPDPPTTAPVTAPMAAPAAAHSKLLMVGLVVVALLAVAAIVVSLQGRGAPAATAPAPGPRFRVVAEGNELRAATPQPTEPAPAAQEPVAAELPPAEAVLAEPEVAAAPKTTRPRTGPDAKSLTRAFRSQQPKIEACFREHAVSLQGQPRMQVGFSLDAGGTLVQVTVEPASLAATPLGACIERAARATKFPAQGEPVSFAIPVTASQGP